MFGEKNHFHLILLIGFFLLVILLLAGYAAPLIIGMVLAALTDRPYEYLKGKLRGQKNLASLLILLLIIFIIVIPFLSVLTVLGAEAFNFFTETKDRLILDAELTRGLTAFNEQFGLTIDVRSVIEGQIVPALKNIGLFLYKETGNVLSGAISLLISFFIMLLTIFYLLRDGKKLGKFLLNLNLIKDAQGIHLFTVFKNTGKAILFGNILSSIAQGILGGIGFFLFGLTSPIFWGTIMAFVALIPFLGPFVIFLPAAVYLFISGSIIKAILFLIFNIIIVSTIDNLIRPIIIGDKINIHPFFIFLSILGGLKVFGLLGVIYGPLIISIFLVLLEMYRDHSHGHEAKT